MLEIHLDDRFVDLVEEGFDLAIRITRLESSSLIARRLAPFSIRLCASPELIEKHGEPQRPQDLASMPCIIDTNGRWLSNWPFVGDNGETITVSVYRPIEVNSPMAARAAALSGLGFAILPDFIAEPDIEAGRLVPMLDDRMPQGRRHLRRLSAPPLSAGQGARLRRFPGAVVQEADRARSRDGRSRLVHASAVPISPAFW